MRANYVEMLMEDMWNIEREITTETLCSIEYEVEYIQSCIESNSILVEKKTTTSKKESIFKRLSNAIHRVFDAFIEKVKELKQKLTPFRKSYLDSLDSISYDGISVNIFPHWNMGFEDIKTKLTEMTRELDRYNKSRDTLSRELSDSASIDDIVKNNRVFKKYYSNDDGYQRIMEKKFSTGDNLNDYKSVEVSTSSSKNIKDVCVIARKYIETYDDNVKQIDQIKINVVKIIDDLDTEMAKAQSSNNENKPVTDSYNPYLVLEGAYLSDTDLCFCKDFGVLFEAENVNKEKEEDSGDVTVTSDAEKQSGNSSGNTTNSTSNNKKTDTTQISLLKNIASIITTALATALKVLEEKLYVYKNLIKHVVTKAKKGNNKSNDDKPAEKSDSVKPTENKEESNKKQEKKAPESKPKKKFFSRFKRDKK